MSCCVYVCIHNKRRFVTTCTLYIYICTHTNKKTFVDSSVKIVQTLGHDDMVDALLMIVVDGEWILKNIKYIEMAQERFTAGLLIPVLEAEVK